MRSTLSIIFFGALLVMAALTLVAQKPTDNECRQMVRDQVTGSSDLAGQILGALAVNRYTVRVEDHLFYKSIYGPDGIKLGTGIFGTVILSE